MKTIGFHISAHRKEVLSNIEKLLRDQRDVLHMMSSNVLGGKSSKNAQGPLMLDMLYSHNNPPF